MKESLRIKGGNYFVMILMTKFLQIQKYYLMSLLRKNTMPEGEFLSPSKKSQFRSKACSQINIFQLGHHVFANASSCKNGRQLGQGDKNRAGFSSQAKPLTKEDVDRIVCKNSLTVNFSDRNAVNALPNITSFDKIKGILIKKPIFERFKEFNKKNGSYHEELEELSREDELERSKLNISSLFKLGSHKQFIKKDRKSLSLISQQSSCILLKNRRMQRISEDSSLKSLRMAKLPSKNSEFDLPIDKASIFFKSKWKTVQKLQDITEACSQACEDDQIQRSINLFAKFSEKMGEGLLRKKKKLEKVFQFRL